MVNLSLPFEPELFRHAFDGHGGGLIDFCWASDGVDPLRLPATVSA